MKKIDCRNWQCPQPVIEVRKAMLADPRQSLEVLLADDAARQNITRLAATSGYSIKEKTNTEFTILTLSPGEMVRETGGRPQASGRTLLVCASNKMGEGDEELGRLLLKNFLITLLETSEIPHSIYLVNSGVKLACAEAETVEILNKLACRGIDIASCGLCLEFYKLKESLQVGRITNMLEIAEAQLSAGLIIRP
ncbi:sulfurtransferase-like selenium metabolism protein YedF [Geopsychrobacter electrodiphilus]|uniref:sulfurtransferase-like selenium metabolism protein YedF n=1 Tax=Geopsychrobacter electrodiphilus TaxID=225196 RepID=UPI00037BBB9D|nr:sulfurtransferase-like selenium metabolism protein YedF [Geopsychrobacter electrodiphilus]